MDFADQEGAREKLRQMAAEGVFGHGPYMDPATGEVVEPIIPTGIPPTVMAENDRQAERLAAQAFELRARVMLLVELLAMAVPKAVTVPVELDDGSFVVGNVKLVPLQADESRMILRTMAEKISDARAALETLTQLASNHLGNLPNLMKEVNQNCHKLLKESTSKISALVQQEAVWTDTINDYKKVIEAMKRAPMDAAHLRDQVQQYSRAYDEARKNGAAWQAKIAELDAKLTDELDRNAHLERRISALKGRITKLDNALYMAECVADVAQSKMEQAQHLVAGYQLRDALNNPAGVILDPVPDHLL